MSKALNDLPNELIKMARETNGADTVEGDLCQQILAAVTKRGYREGWTDDQFVVRQVLKVSDELGEVTPSFCTVGESKLTDILHRIEATANDAARLFKSKNPSDFSFWIDDDESRSNVKSELVDVIIPAMTALAVLGGSVEDIKAKALADVARGTNYNGDKE